MRLLLLGSGPEALRARGFAAGSFDAILAINNAWAVRDDWTIHIHPSDFPPERWPPAGHGRRVVTAQDYVPAQNRSGGFVYAGGTMAFTATYWALDALRPRLIAALGCDMVYAAAGATHFYGTGTPDPLRQDVTLRSLEAKSARARIFAARQGCALVTLTAAPESRLVWPRAAPQDSPAPAPYDAALTEQALAKESRLGYRVASGKYWKQEARFDAAAIDALDALWLRAGALR